MRSKTKSGPRGVLLQALEGADKTKLDADGSSSGGGSGGHTLLTSLGAELSA